MTRSVEETAALAAFVHRVRIWEGEADDTPDIVDIRVTDDTPSIAFQAASDDINAMDDVRGDLVSLLGGCAGILKAMDYAVDEVEIVALPNDQDTHDGGVRSRLKTAWVRELVEGRLTTPELLERADETAELLGNR